MITSKNIGAAGRQLLGPGSSSLLNNQGELSFLEVWDGESTVKCLVVISLLITTWGLEGEELDFLR